MIDHRFQGKVRFDRFRRVGKHHADAMIKCKGAELVAIAARSEISATPARETYPRAFVTTNYRDFATHDDLDVVDVIPATFGHVRNRLCDGEFTPTRPSGVSGLF